MMMTGSTAPIIFDPAHPNFEALTWRPSVAEINQFRAANAAGFRADPSNNHGIGAIGRGWWVLFGLGVAAVVVRLAILIWNDIAAPGTSSTQVTTLIFTVLLVLFGATIPLSVRQHLYGRRSPGSNQLMLTRFAADNGLLYHVRSTVPGYTGCLFTTGTANPYAYDHFTTTSGRPIDFGNYHSYSYPPDGPSAHGTPLLAHSWGFLAIEIDSQLPHLVLESKQWRGHGRSLPLVPDPTQILSLEGDFDRYFTLYCPKEFEQDALYVFTPDLMALLIDDAAPFSVEIIDEWMFFSVPKPFNSLDPAVYRRLFSILGTIGSKIVSQTGQYENPGLEAAESARERPGFHWDPSIVPDGSLPAGDRLHVKSAIPKIIISLVGLAAIVTFFVLLASGRL